MKNRAASPEKTAARMVLWKNLGFGWIVSNKIFREMHNKRAIDALLNPPPVEAGSTKTQDPVESK